MVYWERPGPQNTAKTAELALARAAELGTGHIVVASNTGETARLFVGKGPRVVCVTHHVGFRKPGDDEMSRATREELASAGVGVLTTTHFLSGVDRALMTEFGGVYPAQIVAETLRLFGQGTKVGVEIAVMALDAGLIPYGAPVIAVGGSGRGADTAIVVRPAHGRNFFDTEVLEIICKPRNTRQE